MLKPSFPRYIHPPPLSHQRQPITHPQELNPLTPLSPPQGTPITKITLLMLTKSKDKWGTIKQTYQITQDQIRHNITSTYSQHNTKIDGTSALLSTSLTLHYQPKNATPIKISSLPNPPTKSIPHSPRYTIIQEPTKHPSLSTSSFGYGSIFLVSYPP